MVATNPARQTTTSQTWIIAEPSSLSDALDLLVASDSAGTGLIDGAALALVRAVEAKDPITGGHMRRLAAYALLVGRRLGLSGDALEVVCCGALLHDVGKIGVADAILQKQDRLTDDEYRQIQQHPLIGEQIIASLPIAALIAPIVRGHHERWDGRGYPDALAGEAIHPGARIVAAIDAFDAMTAQRPYNTPMTIDAAMICLRAGAGAQWDPDVVDALIDGLLEIIGEHELAIGAVDQHDDLVAERHRVHPSPSGRRREGCRSTQHRRPPTRWVYGHDILDKIPDLHKLMIRLETSCAARTYYSPRRVRCLIRPHAVQPARLPMRRIPRSARHAAV